MNELIKSNKYYISGIFALNIINEKEITFGDWHGSIWNNINIYPNKKITHFGELGEFNTNMILGDYGIYEGKNMLIEKKNIKTDVEYLYIANHIRAVLDLLYYYLSEHKVVWEVGEAAKDFIRDKNKIIEMLKLSKKLELYLNNEKLDQYKRWYIKQETFLNEV
jgi:hypothetical protein